MPANHARVVRRSLPYVIVGLAVMGAVFHRYRDTSRPPPHAPALVDSAIVAAHPVTTEAHGTGPANHDALPPSLAGTVAPRLSTDSSGHLARTRGVRDFFDYYLSARDDANDQALDSLVEHEIIAQLGEGPARQEAMDAWRRYGRYLAELAAQPDGGIPPSNGFNANALRQALDVRASMARHTLGEWYEPFFGAEQRQQRLDLARLQIASDASLSDAQKSAQLTALAEQESPAQRDEERQAKAQRDGLAQISQLQKSHAAPDEIRAQITPTLGPDVAERVVEMQAQEDAWRSKYDDYAAQRARIDSQNLPDQTREALVAQLRQRIFTDPGDALCAASFDHGEPSPHSR